MLLAGSHKSERRCELQNLYDKRRMQVRGNSIVCESFDSAIDLIIGVDAEACVSQLVVSRIQALGAASSQTTAKSARADALCECHQQCTLGG